MAEILSPAGSEKSLYAAVRSGADAVYFGLGDFNARRNAENFSEESILSALEYCRKNGVKAYLALNTSLYCNELEGALNTAIFAAKAGVDGIICTDLGLCSLIKKALPEMPMHASTQLTVHSPSALYTLKELGFCRVVPSRELSKTQIEEICKTAKALNMEVEVFIHGALCMSMSGQCLLSANLGGRSGNRGLCAGTCRLPFSVGKSEYALSLKDMSYIDYLTELESMGVASFKIEGRMKPPEYVAAVTFAAKEKLQSGKNTVITKDILQKVFSRSGFTDGYYTEKRQNMFGFRTQENRIETENILSSIHELYRTEKQKIKIDATFICKADSPVTLIFSDGNNKAEVLGDTPQKAQNKPISKESVKQNLEKLGGTPYILNSLEAILDGNLFVPAAKINDLRRKCTEQIDILRQKAKPNYKIVKTDVNFSNAEVTDNFSLYAQFRSIEQIPENIGSLAGIIVPFEEYAKAENLHKNIIAELPAGIESEEKIIKALKSIPKNVTLLIENIAYLHIAKKLGYSFFVGAELNVFNSHAKDVYKNLGASKIVLSAESRQASFKSFGKNCGAYIYGKMPLMLTKNCPIKNAVGCKNCTNSITDRKGVTFPVYCRLGFSRLYNSVPLYLADKLADFNSLNFCILLFTTENNKEAENIIKAYINKEKPPTEFTRGLYKKGVL